jgi:hypothetical protein
MTTFLIVYHTTRDPIQGFFVSHKHSIEGAKEELNRYCLSYDPPVIEKVYRCLDITDISLGKVPNPL